MALFGVGAKPRNLEGLARGRQPIWPATPHVRACTLASSLTWTPQEPIKQQYARTCYRPHGVRPFHLAWTARLLTPRHLVEYASAPHLPRSQHAVKLPGHRFSLPLSPLLPPPCHPHRVCHSRPNSTAAMEPGTSATHSFAEFKQENQHIEDPAGDVLIKRPDVTFTPEEEKKLYRRVRRHLVPAGPSRAEPGLYSQIDGRIMPILSVLYLLSFMVRWSSEP